MARCRRTYALEFTVFGAIVTIMEEGCFRNILLAHSAGMVVHMRIPQMLKKGDLLGISAPSAGVAGALTRKLDNAIKQFGQLGFECIETKSVRNCYKQTSSSSRQRAEEFMDLYLNDRVKAIIPPWGGEFLMDMLPHLDFELLKKAEPKWILGFSDISTLLFALTTKCDFATAHGPNFMDFGNTPIDPSVLDALSILQGSGEFEQKSLEKYQVKWPDGENAPYNLTEKVEWKIIGGSRQCNFRGRLIGGCMDVICKLIGTQYEAVNEYIEKYKDDGIVWYLESCEMNSAEIYRTLWQMKMNGWFRYCTGFIYGRPEGYSDLGDFNFVDALTYPLEELNIPIIYNADLGHMPPQLLFINGTRAFVDCCDGRGLIRQSLK